MYKVTVTYNPDRKFAYDDGHLPRADTKTIQANFEVVARLLDDGKLLLRGIDVDTRYRNVDKVEIERIR